MNLLVGSTGFVGGHVVEYLFQQNEISKGIFRKGARLKILDLNGVQCVEADLLDHHSLHEAVEGVETIYSMASPSPVGGGDYRINTEGIENLLEAATEFKVKTMVHLSTLDVFGFGVGRVSDSSLPQPSGEYQESKLEADRRLLEFSKREKEPRVVIIRPARAIGSRDPSLIVPLLRMIESGKVVLPRSRPMSFSHPKDIASAMYLTATRQVPSGTVFLLKSFDSTPAELALGMVKSLAKSADIRTEGMFSKVRLASYTANQLRASLLLDNQASWGEIGYSPQYNLETVCDEVAQWYRKEPWAIEDA
jgi:nucleoside-diphosphate-sugar epimerase